jgi:hypothetical protein
MKKMSSKFVDGRKERIKLMLHWSKIETEDLIKRFEEYIAENPKDNTKEFFNEHYWVRKPKFMAQFGNETGIRARLAEEYFNQVVASEDIQISMRGFRNCEVVNEYWKNHKFNGD